MATPIKSEAFTQEVIASIQSIMQVTVTYYTLIRQQGAAQQVQTQSQHQIAELNKLLGLVQETSEKVKKEAAEQTKEKKESQNLVSHLEELKKMLQDDKVRFQRIEKLTDIESKAFTDVTAWLLEIKNIIKNKIPKIQKIAATEHDQALKLHTELRSKTRDLFEKAEVAIGEDMIAYNKEVAELSQAGSAYSVIQNMVAKYNNEISKRMVTIAQKRPEVLPIVQQTHMSFQNIVNRVGELGKETQHFLAIEKLYGSVHIDILETIRKTRAQNEKLKIDDLKQYENEAGAVDACIKRIKGFYESIRNTSDPNRRMTMQQFRTDLRKADETIEITVKEIEGFIEFCKQHGL
jgi:hypothetical protein